MEAVWMCWWRQGSGGGVTVWIGEGLHPTAWFLCGCGAVQPTVALPVINKTTFISLMEHTVPQSNDFPVCLGAYKHGFH